MNALIIYDSQYGNTELIAGTLAGALNKNGDPWKAQAVLVSKAGPIELKEIDILIVGSPTQKWGPTLAMKAFIENLPDMKGIPTAAFDTRFKMSRILTGSASRRIAGALIEKHAALILPPESFFVKGMEGPLLEGELERAANWAGAITEKHTAPGRQDKSDDTQQTNDIP